MGKVVLDANVLISAAYGGTPLDAVSKAFFRGRVFLSKAVIQECESAIGRLSPKLGKERTKRLLSLWERLVSHCEVVEPGGTLSICRDPKDDAYLALGAAVGADYLVTGDKDLLSVDPGKHSSLPGNLKILTPRQFVDLVE
jgi:putative PIN family toxin of toxin-antitoxin system